MSKADHKFVSFALSTATAVLLSCAIFPVAYAGSSSSPSTQIDAKQSGSSYKFTRDLTIGEQGDDVKSLQQFLNAHGAQVSANGPGSSGNETTYFGRATRAALAKWQAAHGVTPSAGYFGPKSRFAMAKVTEDPPLSPLQSPSSISAPSSPNGEPIRGTDLLQSSSTKKATSQDLTNGIPIGSFQGVPLEEMTISGLPVRLKIPVINVDAAVEYVGLTQDGAMAVPKGPEDVGWFNLGPRPGEVGSAVIAGHWGWKNSISAVFDFLHNLQKGDRIYVIDEKGVLIAFVVRDVRTLGENADASDVFGSSDGKAHLNLITCEGIWNKATKSYSNRIVVFADKEMI